MAIDETSSPAADLTDTLGVQESADTGSTDPSESDNTSESKEKAGFQKALQRAREAEKEALKKAEEAESRLAALRRKEKEAEKESMSELEFYRREAERSAEEKSKLGMEIAVDRETSGKDLPKSTLQLLRKNPWSIPQVEERLDGTQTWEEVADLVKRYLPDYVNSLMPQKEETLADTSARVDSERATDDSVVKNHVYTAEEIKRLSADPVEWEKHREAVLKQLEQYGGKLPE